MKKIKLIIIFGLGLLLLFSFYRTRPWTASAQTIPGGFPVVADFNGDGYVNLIDFEIWRQNRFISIQTPTPTTSLTGQPTNPPATPTPTGLPPATPTPTGAACRTAGQRCSAINRCCSGLDCKLIGDNRICWR